jgi:hypothetical protein
VSLLTDQGIMAKHKLSLKEFEEIKKELGQLTLLDMLFHFPDGPRYDTALNLVAHNR